MRKIILSALVVTLLTVTATFAQQRGGNANQRGMNPEEMAKRRTEMMTEQLGLSEEQSKSIHALYLAQMAERQKSMPQNQGGERPTETQRAERMKRFQDTQTKLNEDIKKLLNEEQIPKFEKLLKEQQQRGSRRGGSTNGGGRSGGSAGTF